MAPVLVPAQILLFESNKETTAQFSELICNLGSPAIIIRKNNNNTRNEKRIKMNEYNFFAA